MNRDAFANCNPVISFLFFAVAVVFGMFFVHPAFLACSCALSAACCLTVKGLKAVRLLACMAPVFAFIALINPFFNIYGQTVLFTCFGGRPYTLEALYYGMAVGGIFVTVILWFASYNVIMTSDKFLYLFGRTIPSISLVLTMILRLVPNFRRKILQISGARRSIGKAGNAGSSRERVDNGLTVISALTGWALEGSIVTADSMRSRGFGSDARSSFSIYRFESKDALLLFVITALAAAVLLCGVRGGMAASYTPRMEIAGFDNIYSALGMIAYFLLLSVPTALNIAEALTWRILKSRI